MSGKGMMIAAHSIIRPRAEKSQLERDTAPLARVGTSEEEKMRTKRACFLRFQSILFPRSDMGRRRRATLGRVLVWLRYIRDIRATQRRAARRRTRGS